MGLDWSAQFRRTKRDTILSEGIAIMATPFAKEKGLEAAKHETAAGEII